MPVSVESIEQAAKAIADANRVTPLIRSTALETRLGLTFPLFFKADNLQLTGSFKSRGALNKLLSLTESERSRGLIAASAGNHAQGVAFHAQRLGLSAKIVMPLTTPWVKVNATRQWGPEIILFGESYQESYDRALQIQKDENRVFIHAFEDDLIMSGQGTIAVEILKQVPEIENLVAPIGGGGLMAGCATYLKGKKKNIKIWGVQAQGCSTFLPSIEAGAPVTLKTVATIAEGMSAKRMGDQTFDICRKLVDASILVSDEEIAEGLLWLLENERLFVEGCGGAAVAAAIKLKDQLKGPTCIVLSGGNLDVNLLSRIIERGLVKAGRILKLEFTIPDVPGTLHRLTSVFASERASIAQVQHERVFGETSLREVQTNVVLETQGQEHNARLQQKLKENGWNFRIVS